MSYYSIGISKGLAERVKHLVSSANDNSGFARFWYQYGDLHLSNGVIVRRTGQAAPVWGNGLFVHFYGHLVMEESHAKELASSFGLLTSLMSDEIDLALAEFIRDKDSDHSDFYDQEDNPSNYDSFYSSARFLERPFELTFEVFGFHDLPTGSKWFYSLVDENSRYTSYSDYFSDFFLEKMESYLVRSGCDWKSVMNDIRQKEDAWVSWFESIDNIFFEALAEVESKFLTFVETIFCGGE